MQTFKKVLAVSLSFIITVTVFSAIIIEPFFKSEYEYYNDANLRESLAGKLDYLFIGASNGLCAFVPPVADKEMGVCSYNLSGGLMTWYGRLTMLKKELERNPVKKVIVEISYDAMARSYHDAWGDNITLCRLGSFSERMEYLFKNVSVKDLGDVYGAILGDGVAYSVNLAKNFVIGKILGGEEVSLNRVPYESKGFHDKTLEGESSLKVTPETARKIYNSSESMCDFTKKNVEVLREIVDLCRGKNIDVTFVVVPHSDYVIFEYDNWDKLSQQWQALADEMGCRLIDFNLLKNRYELFRDDVSFFDKVHLTAAGAETFTAEYSRVMMLADKGEDISSLFFENYEEMKALSPYMQYVQDTGKAA